jgi:hypothetical protein
MISSIVGEDSVGASLEFSFAWCIAINYAEYAFHLRFDPTPKCLTLQMLLSAWRITIAVPSWSLIPESSVYRWTLDSQAYQPAKDCPNTCIWHSIILHLVDSCWGILAIAQSLQLVLTRADMATFDVLWGVIAPESLEEVGMVVRRVPPQKKYRVRGLGRQTVG